MNAASGQPSNMRQMKGITMSMTPAERSLRGRIGAHVVHQRHSGRELTASARTAFLARFEAAVDPEGVLPEDERKRRAEHALKEHMARLSYASARVRRQRASAKGGQSHAR
jgi:hypothetical protein